MAANLISSRLTVLVRTGRGREELLLRAGLLHRFRRDQPGALRVAVAYVDRWGDDPAGTILQAVAAEASRLGDGRVRAVAGPDSRSTRRSPRGRTARRTAARDPRPVRGVLPLSPAGRARFDLELPRAIERRDLRARFLIRIREDALAALDRYKGRVGDLFGNRLRLDHLSREAAADAIRFLWTGTTRRPGRGDRARARTHRGGGRGARSRVGWRWPRRAAARRAGAQRRGQGGPDRDAYLQLVMAALWRREMEAGSTTLRVATVRRMGGATQVVRDHVDHVMHTLSASSRRQRPAYCIS